MADRNLTRMAAAALVQPDPFEPDAEICGVVQGLLQDARVPESYGPVDDIEIMVRCRMCGEYDSHGDGCPVLGLEAWLDGDDAPKPSDHLPALTRYRAGAFGGMVPSDAGQWVSYADVQTLLAALVLRAEAVRR